MKISINWIKDWVDLDGISPEEIVERFNLSTAEIEGVEYRGANVSGVVVGKIVELEDIEGSKNHLLKVDVGDEQLQIVCGAPNARVGLVTCVAKVGANVQGFKITEAKRNGISSFGMCCGADELGIGSDTTGIIELPAEYESKLGVDIKTLFPIDDVVFEIDNKSLTNRPDLWGHYGMARELACIFKRELKPIEALDLSAFDGLPEVGIKVESAGCQRYSAMTAENITVKKSPIPMAIRLCYCGMRDINLLADITNYVMLEIGQPMHAFDGDKVQEIVVKDADKGEKLLTLEGEEHEMPEGAIVIRDGNRVPVAIAGVKGGMLSGISDETTSVLFESATFESSKIRKASRTIGLITDSSQRYEKSLDPEMTELALARILKILKDVDAGIVVTSSFSDCYPFHYETKTITVTPEFICSRVGAEISADVIVETLVRLGFAVKCEGKEINITVPSWRGTKDVSMKEDIVEEVARIYGYDNIEAKPFAFPSVPAVQMSSHTNEYSVKYLLSTKYGMNELHSYIWNYEAFNKEYNILAVSHLALKDSSNAGQSGLRSELVPTLLKFFHENKNSFDNMGIYEIGRVVTGFDENGLAIEKKKLAVLLASTEKSEEELFFEMKAIALDISKNVIGVDADLVRAENFPAYVHPRAVGILKTREAEYGYLGLLHPTTMKALDKKYKVAVMELDFGALASARAFAVKAKQVSKFQNVIIDFTFMVPENMKWAEFMAMLSKCRSKILRGYSYVTEFKSGDMAGMKALTVKAELASFDHTLTSDEIESFRNEVIVTMLKNKINLKA